MSKGRQAEGRRSWSKHAGAKGVKPLSVHASYYQSARILMNARYCWRSHDAGKSRGACRGTRDPSRARARRRRAMDVSTTSRGRGCRSARGRLQLVPALPRADGHRPNRRRARTDFAETAPLCREPTRHELEAHRCASAAYEIAGQHERADVKYGNLNALSDDLRETQILPIVPDRQR